MKRQLILWILSLSLTQVLSASISVFYCNKAGVAHLTEESAPYLEYKEGTLNWIAEDIANQETYDSFTRSQKYFIQVSGQYNPDDLRTFLENLPSWILEIYISPETLMEDIFLANWEISCDDAKGIRYVRRIGVEFFTHREKGFVTDFNQSQIDATDKECAHEIEIEDTDDDPFPFEPISSEPLSDEETSTWQGLACPTRVDLIDGETSQSPINIWIPKPIKSRAYCFVDGQTE
ncbi:MAG: hypothetical protein A2007_03655 [Verrucomicrobia bacterium GWC2_42_7]|nr:MAG: hypothetical protein A2007_03655 [Verrucomicrobia bacterium GWC2_42_7]